MEIQSAVIKVMCIIFTYYSPLKVHYINVSQWKIKIKGTKDVALRVAPQCQIKKINFTTVVFWSDQKSSENQNVCY